PGVVAKALALLGGESVDVQVRVRQMAEGAAALETHDPGLGNGAPWITPILGENGLARRRTCPVPASQDPRADRHARARAEPRTAGRISAKQRSALFALTSRVLSHQTIYSHVYIALTGTIPGHVDVGKPRMPPRCSATRPDQSATSGHRISTEK